MEEDDYDFLYPSAGKKEEIVMENARNLCNYYGNDKNELYKIFVESHRKLDEISRKE